MADQIQAPPGSAAELGAQIAAFTAVVEKLADDLVGNVQRVERFSQRTRRITVVLAISLTLDLVLTGIVGLLGVLLDQSNHRISQVQQTTSDEALCPLYGLIVTGYHPELRPAGAQRTQYITDYKVLLNGYEALDCKPVLPNPFASPSPKGR